MSDSFDELLNHACDRLFRLTRVMLRDFPQLRRWEQTDDVLQGALIRLHRALQEVQPDSEQHFYNLATVQIRRELLDLAKHHLGPEGGGANHHTDGQAPDEKGGVLAVRAESVEEPTTVAEWTEFHTLIESLPVQERDVFDLIWYQGLPQEDAAKVLGISVRTVKRRWQSARLLLARLHENALPE